mmetsp:Transcript_20667/g.36816  ORF Transcript_20667/g.36816 Transcript_20667/m.36816 type:complete len:468 (+) Transcript_20667:104-1507(+)
MGQNLCSSPATDKDDWEHRKDGKLMLQHLYEDPGKKKRKSTGSPEKEPVAAVKHWPERAPERGPQTMPVPAPSPPPMRERGIAPSNPSRERAAAPPPLAPAPAQASGSASASSSSKPVKSSSSSASRKDFINETTPPTSPLSPDGNNPDNANAVTPTLIPELGGGVGGKDWKADEFIRLITDARGRRDDAMAKRLLKQVAESNYVMRSNWKIPRTISVSVQKCSTNRVRGKGKDPKVSFSYLDTADAVRRLAAQDRRRRICALNFANGEHVGGGYKNGSQAQEEDLCRRIPSLYTSLNNAKRDGLYPFGPCTCFDPKLPAKYSEVLYTKGCVIARGSEADGFALLRPDEQVMLSLVTAAAPNINFAKEIYDLNLMHETIKSVFIAPLLEEPQINTLVLGAWGCGAFGGDPEQISELFMRALTDGLGRLYNEVHFAVPEGRNADVFRAALDRNKITVVDVTGMNSRPK